MPLQVNEHAINKLAAITGVEAAKLKSEIVVDADKAPDATTIDTLLSDVVIMKKTDHETLLDNNRKTKFDEGKHRSLVDLTKHALGDKAFEVTKDMTREDVWAKIEATKKAEWEKESGKTPDEKLAQWNKEKEKLQGLVGEKQTEAEKLKEELERTKTQNLREKKVVSAVSKIPFTATGEILSQQQDTLTSIILNSYTHKVEDGKDVWYDQYGNKQVDHLQNPKSIEDIVKEKAVIFPTSKADNGRSDSSSKNNSNNSSGDLDAELAKCTSLLEVGKLLTARGLSSIDTEGRAIIDKWNKLQVKA